MTTPPAPQGVTLHTPDGHHHPVTLTYVGVRDGDGIHVWHADTPVPLDASVRITADTLPPKTQITFTVRGDQ